ncbi:Hypothetical predicted protein [Lecanosticta acicola]|uniref:Uncharacterized protein n=1 Tax=Lecanosticta acicola TaxID=111012 RepID=A0AAI9ED52_9PEZI|nr:Hypothetical predicted protein [Lecanosticta acicola]
MTMDSYVEGCLTEAAVNLGFWPTNQRNRSLMLLVAKHLTAESQRTCRDGQGNFMQLKRSDVLDYASVSFIQEYGPILWTDRMDERRHLNDTWRRNESGVVCQTTFIWNHDQCAAGKVERSLFESVLGSALGRAVRSYFGLMDQVPNVALEDAMGMSAEALVWGIMMV